MIVCSFFLSYNEARKYEMCFSGTSQEGNDEDGFGNFL